MQKDSSPGELRQRLGTAAVLVLILCSLARAFGGPDSLSLATAASALLLIGAGFPSINPRLRHTGLVLAAISVLVLPFARNPAVALQRGMFVAGQLLALTASVMLIARCAVRSHRIGNLGAGLREREGRARHFSFALATQFFSGVLGLAGANLMYVMAAPPSDKPDPLRTATVVSVSRGFTAASCWSPVFGNMAILLTLYPSLTWTGVFPIGLALGQLVLATGVLMSPRRPPQSDAPPPTPAAELLMTALPVLLSMAGMLGLILLISRGLHVVISAAIVMIAPVVSLSFHAAIGSAGRRWADGARGLAQSMRHFPSLASEAILFVSAGCAGSILASAFPASWVSALGHALAGHPFPGFAFLLFCIMAIAVAGIHPVLTAVFMATTFTPQVLGLPPLAHMAAILAGWALSSCITPFSVLSLTASRYSGEGLVQVSLGRNWRFAVVNALAVCLLLTAYVYLRQRF